MKKSIFILIFMMVAVIVYAAQTNFEIAKRNYLIESKSTGTTDDSVYTAVFTSPQRYYSGFNVGVHNPSTNTNTISFIIRTYVRLDSTIPDTLVSDTLQAGENYFFDRSYPSGKVQVLLKSTVVDSHATYIVDCIGEY